MFRMGISFFLLWVRVPIQSEVGLCIYYCIVYFLFVAFSSMLEVPYGSLTTRLTRACLAVALLSVTMILITAFGTKERVRPIEEENKITVWESLKAAFKNPPLMFAIAMYTLTITGFEVSNFMLMYFLNYGLHVNGDVTFVMIAYFGISFCTLPLWNTLAQKLNKTLAYAIALGGLIAVRVLMLFLPDGVNAIYIWLFMGASGFFFSGAQTLPWAIVPDSLEYDEYKTGHRHEGVFYALMATIRGAMVSIMLPCMLLIMENFGFVSGAATQPESASMAIRLIYTLVPILLFAATIILTRIYPLPKERFEQIKAELEKRKESQD